MLELTVAIAIIAILAAILFPIFARSRERARTVSCASNLFNIGLALHMYAQEHDGKFPPPNNNEAGIMSYLQNPSIFNCPSQSVGVSTTSGPRVYACYVYQPGLGNDARGSLRLLWDGSFVHNGGANVLFVGGAVKWLGTATWTSRGWLDPINDSLPIFPSSSPQDVRPSDLP
jgi:prepilin-type processing-associated H-X9-DG protein